MCIFTSEKSDVFLCTNWWWQRTRFQNQSVRSIGLAIKWLRILSVPPNDKIRSHLVANLIAFSNVFSTSTYNYVRSIFRLLGYRLLRDIVLFYQGGAIKISKTSTSICLVCIRYTEVVAFYGGFAVVEWEQRGDQNSLIAAHLHGKSMQRVNCEGKWDQRENYPLSRCSLSRIDLDKTERDGPEHEQRRYFDLIKCSSRRIAVPLSES